MQQPADKKMITRVLPVPVPGGRREVTREEIEQAADQWADYEDSSSYGDLTEHGNGNDDEPGIYVTAAFRCSFGEQAYLFMGYEYMLLDYDSSTLDGAVLDGPKRISKGIPSLNGTVFSDYGIYCAFGLHHRNEAFIFSGNECARIAYARDGSDFKILQGPTVVCRMFPYLKGTAFENYVGSAFESSTTDNEAYIFRGIDYAVINYEDGCLISDKQTFDCLNDTVFQSGFDAAFASHVHGEAFIFKDDSYALINFVDQRIIGDVKKILPDVCPSLSSVLPRDNFQNVEDLEDFIIYSVNESDEDHDEQDFNTEYMLHAP